MSSEVSEQPSSGRWHAIGLTAYLAMLALYAGAGDADATRLYWILGAAAFFAVTAALIGLLRGWQKRRGLLLAWPVASLIATILAGAADSQATRELPGTITVTFAYLGLTCGRWRSLAVVPLGVAAFVIGGGLDLPGKAPKVILAVAMWVLVSEVPAWLISRLEKQSALLRRIAETDALTSLLDRSTLGPRLSQHASESAVVLIDLDNFKGYNDRHGHEAGDELLVAFAEALRSSTRKDDAVFRIGGDEFLLLLVAADRAEAEQVVDRLRRRWAQAESSVGFSAGIATGEQNLMRLADEHMYAAKRSRRLLSD
ncbi:diguanylate cyclase [Mycobacterium sp. 1423905.2]|uniref:GGDEF domain-containing protein n=1 Tax=Mycobacterium sp. 1423905.2 TaxID=1856859 RepID=UPI0007FBF8CF|nr:GGDEF domain-containing protein [Mycobacterium sp. 1423905.2]OBJ52389.1 diguanylate cyclase [Mycobacterium sp. 1423905.2]